jgi:hypothetical protein
MDSQSGPGTTPESDNKGRGQRPGIGLIDRWLGFTEALPTPLLFRLWAGIHMVGSAVERRVWTQLGGGNRLYPNLYVFLVGPPGVGKSQALSPAMRLLRKSAACKLAPNDMTKQGLLDALLESGSAGMIDGQPFDYHYMAAYISELSNFMSKYDGALAGVLTDIFDCPDVNEEYKRGKGESLLIPSPGMSMLVGTATQNLGATISDELWGSGFMARVIMVYSADIILPEDIFRVQPDHAEDANAIASALARIGKLQGPMTWDPLAQKELNEFLRSSKKDAPLHNRLEHYGTRRWLHLAKLTMIGALQRESMTVTRPDMDMAREWLLDAEAFMPEIFKDMVRHEDGGIYVEMAAQFFPVYLSTRRPIAAATLYKWLSSRVAAHQVERFLQIAVAAGYLNRVAGTEGLDAEYIPVSATKNPGMI